MKNLEMQEQKLEQAESEKQQKQYMREIQDCSTRTLLGQLHRAGQDFAAPQVGSQQMQQREENWSKLRCTREKRQVNEVGMRKQGSWMQWEHARPQKLT